jgi:hypothetical protein
MATGCVHFDHPLLTFMHSGVLVAPGGHRHDAQRRNRRERV